MGKTARNRDKMAVKRGGARAVVKKRPAGHKLSVQKKPACVTTSRRRAGVFYMTKKKANAQAMRNLEQDPFPAVVKYSERQCKQLLMKAGVILRKAACKKLRCWACKGSCSLQQDGKRLRCVDKGCRKSVTHPAVAYTPMWASCRRGKGMTCQQLVRYAYCASLRIPQDAARHLTGLGYHLVQRIDKDIRVAAAYAEHADNKDIVFNSGEVDMDVAASATDRTDKNATTFKGRFLVFKDRATKKQVWKALPDKVATKGKKNMTPETFEEVAPIYFQHMADGALHMSDGSPALKKCAATLGLPAATVVHGRQEYVRPVKFLKSALSPAAKAAVMKRPASNSKTWYHTLAGDQAVEGVFGNTQQSRTRSNLHGRAAGNNAHVNQLAASFFMRKPGLNSVLAAMKAYREYAQKALSPEDAVCHKNGGLKVQTPWLGLQ